MYTFISGSATTLNDNNSLLPFLTKMTLLSNEKDNSSHSTLPGTYSSPGWPSVGQLKLSN